MTGYRYLVHYAARGPRDRVWCDIPDLFDGVDAAVAIAAFVEGQGWTSKIVDADDPDSIRPFPRHGSCSNANLGTFGHECGKPAVWIGTSSTGYQSGRCDRCHLEGDERFGLAFIRLPHPEGTSLLPSGP